jgi:hypothetical protein
VLTLYGDEHPRRAEVEEEVFRSLVRLKELEALPTVTFLDDEVVVNRRPLRELRGWRWAPRLSEVGIQRIEFPSTPNSEDLQRFLEEASARLTRRRSPLADGDPGSGKPGTREHPAHDPQAGEHLPGVMGASIRFGRVGLGGHRLEEEAAAPVVTATLDFGLAEELEATDWLQAEVRQGRTLPVAEAEAVVRSLAVAARRHEAVLATLLRSPVPGEGGAAGGARPDPFASAHAMNTSVLAMALAEFLEMDSRAVRTVGTAGLLHDVGMARVPPEILARSGPLSPEERLQVERHPVEGARLLLGSEDRLEVAAVVACEHHVRYDGTGYPRFRIPRPLHPASHMVQVCATFDTLMSHRPWRARWNETDALAYLDAGAGTEFHPEFAREFVRMIRLERRL